MRLTNEDFARIYVEVEHKLGFKRITIRDYDSKEGNGTIEHDRAVAQVSEEATLEAAREWLVGVCTRHKDRQGKPMNCIRWNCGWCRGDFERGEMPE